MTTATVAARARALGTLTAVLRGDADATLPVDATAWGAFLDLGAAHGLLPAAYVALRSAGRAEVPGALVRALDVMAPADRTVPELVLRRAYDRNVERVQRLTDAGVELLQRCAADGVRAVPLKGLHSLLAGTWPDPAMRTMVDLDVLVAADRAPDVFASLQAAGYDEHPEPIGEHADHHLPMLRREDITVEVHTELLVSRWRPLVPAASVLQRAMFRPTRGGTLLLAEDTDAFVHLVAHAQLQEETYTLFGLPLRALHETAQLRYSGPRYATSVDLADARDRFARVDRAHVLDAHLEAARRLFAAEVPEGRGPPRAAVHTLVAEGALAAPSVGRAWTYAVRLPRSFGEARMLDEFGPGSGPRWLWTSRARHAARRVSVHLGGREH